MNFQSDKNSSPDKRSEPLIKPNAVGLGGNAEQSRYEITPTYSFRHAPLRIALIYSLCAATWIIGSDWLLGYVPIASISVLELSLFKGLLFTAVTAVILFFLVRRLQHHEQVLGSRVQDVIASTQEGLWIWDILRDQIEVTPGGDKELGWAAASSIRNIKSWRAIVHPDDWDQIDQLLEAFTKPGPDTWLIEQRILTRQGNWHWFEIKGRILSRDKNGAVELIEGTYHSIDNLKRNQSQLLHANRALRLLLSAYKSVNAAKTKYELFSLLVQQAATTPEYTLVWVGKAATTPEKPIVPVSVAGSAREFLDLARITWGADKYGQGPSGTCINTGKPSIIPDVKEHSSAKPWLSLLERFEIRSAVSIPIILEDGEKYALQLGCIEPGCFSVDEMETYEMISRVLSIAVNSLDLNIRFTESETARLKISERLQTALRGTIAALTQVVEKRDPYTAGHQKRVADLSVAIGTEMGIPNERLEGIHIGASIHDIGKIGVPTEILSKPGRLDDEEIALIRRHAAIGNDIVQNIEFGWPIQNIVHQHHERWDGSGYPKGLKADEIALEARVVAVADVIESMGTDRPYRPSIPWQRVIDEVEDGRGSRYDPAVVDAALSVLSRDAAKFGFGPRAS